MQSGGCARTSSSNACNTLAIVIVASAPVATLVSAPREIIGLVKPSRLASPLMNSKSLAAATRTVTPDRYSISRRTSDIAAQSARPGLKKVNFMNVFPVDHGGLNRGILTHRLLQL